MTYGAIALVANPDESTAKSTSTDRSGLALSAMATPPSCITNPELARLQLQQGMRWNAEVNLSLLKSGKVKGVRFSTLDKICTALGCQPGELLEHRPGD